jgi:TonB family protein
MKKLSLLLFLSLLICLHVTAQRKNTYLFKNNGEYVLSADSADYFRFVEEPEKGSKLYLTKEFYIDGTRKGVGYSSKIEPPVYEGQHVSYYKNGNKREIAYYVKGQLTDSLYKFHPNGNIYSISYITHPADTMMKIITVKDSTGKDLVVNGNGEFTYYDNNFKYAIEKGTVKNGLRDGIWTGETEDQVTFKDTYSEGKLVSGTSTDEDGQTYTYTEVFVHPTFPGGPEKFYRYVRTNLMYPENALAKRYQGNVIVRFKVLHDGSLNDIHAINYAVPELAAEATRMVKSSPKWKPGVYRGMITEMSYTVPISFTIR